MAKEHEEKLVKALVEGLLEAQDENECEKISEYIGYIGRARRFADYKTEIRADFKKSYIHEERHFYINNKKKMIKDAEEMADKDIGNLLSLIGQKKNIRIHSKPIFESLEERLIKKLELCEDIWDSAKLIDALDSLYYWLDEDGSYSEERIIEVVENMNNYKQKRMAIVCARLHNEMPDSFLKFFRLDEEI